jgi:hypothetical protein
MSYQESQRYLPKTYIEAILYPGNKSIKPSILEVNKNVIGPAEVDRKLYPIQKPKQKPKELKLFPINKEELISNLCEQISQKQELTNFINAICLEYPRQNGNFSESFTYKELLDKFRNYRNIENETPLFEKFSEIKIMRLLQRLYHSGLIVLDFNVVRSYKIDYNESRNSYINPKVF